jgi:hypothetical protein
MRFLKAFGWITGGLAIILITLFVASLVYAKVKGASPSSVSSGADNPSAPAAPYVPPSPPRPAILPPELVDTMVGIPGQPSPAVVGGNNTVPPGPYQVGQVLRIKRIKLKSKQTVVVHTPELYNQPDIDQRYATWTKFVIVPNDPSKYQVNVLAQDRWSYMYGEPEPFFDKKQNKKGIMPTKFAFTLANKNEEIDLVAYVVVAKLP